MKRKFTACIIGKGEVGKSLQKVLDCDIQDKENKGGEFDIIHICFPYSEEFESEVKRYQEIYKPRYTIVHSTVKPGTCRKLGAIHSPIIGMHPNLSRSITTFTKFLGGEKASEVADYFRKFGIKVYIFDKPETTEVMKILDTTFWGICAEYTKDVKRQSIKYDIPFEAWTIWTQVYNQGYKDLGFPEYARPNLVPIMKKLGGHCVISNTEMLQTVFTKLLKELND